MRSAQPEPGNPSRVTRRGRWYYARTPVEQAICSDPVLAAKDRRMARLYEKAGGSRFGPVEPTQRAWLAARDACARVGGPALHACLHHVYDARIAELGR